MEPPGGLPPDRDRQLVLRAQPTPQQQQLVPLQQVKPALTLNLQQHALSNIASSQAAAVALAAPNSTTASTSSSAAVVATTTALVVATSTAANTIAISSGSNNSTSSTSPALTATTTTVAIATQAATTHGGSSVAQQPSQTIHPHHHHHQHQHQPQPQTQHQHQPHQHHHSQHGHNSSSATSSLLGGISSSSSSGTAGQQQTIEKLSRPMAFDKMEALVREMQDPENGVPVRQQKMFLTSIPYAFMGYDLIEWLMDRLLIEESEALNIANQLCLHGYFFPVNDTKTLTVKDDSSLYRFQTPYYWPWQHKAPDNVEYAIYLAKRSLRNKQRHALEDYEAEALASLHKNLKGKWDFISMQAEEQVRLAKERKKGDKIVGDSQERAYWRVHRPPPGQFTPLEPCPIPSRDRQGVKPNKKKTIEDAQRDVDYLKKSLNRTRMKMSQACESLVAYSETFAEYDFFLQPVLPSNPWVTEDVTFWQLNNTFVDIPTEKRVKRWAISIEELVSDPTGLQEFTSFLEKEYSHENIRFWIAVNRLRRSAHSQVPRKVHEIYEEFLKPGAPCEINIDGKTMESVLKGLKNPSRFTFDAASEHIYTLLLKKDCYPRFIRSEHYKRLLETGIQPSHKKRFFNFGGVSGAKKKMTAALSSQPNLGEMTAGSKAVGNVSAAMMQAPPPGNLARRRGSDRSLTGSAHELAVIGVNKDITSKVPHSHSQSNLSEIPYRETPKPKAARLETTVELSGSAVCPWDMPDEPPAMQAPTPVAAAAAPAKVKLSICPWEQESSAGDGASASVGKTSSQRLTSRISEYHFGQPSVSAKTSSTPSPTVGSQNVVDTNFPPTIAPLFTSLQAQNVAAIAAVTAKAAGNTITKDPPSSSDAEIEEELNKLSISERNSECESSTSELSALPPPTPTPPPLTKVTPPPPEDLGTVAENQEAATTAEFNLQECAISELPCEAEGRESGSGAESETEVEVLVQEVQIELIENVEYQENKSPQLATPTIQVEEEEGEGDESVFTETVASGEPDNESQRETPTCVRTAPPSPERELCTTTTLERQTGTYGAKLHTSSSTGALPGTTPPPPPPIGPMEEEEQLKEEENTGGQEELSPTTDEYQEGLQFGADSKDDYEYDIVDTDSQVGYIAPAPTPAPSMAPLAELDVDTVDDEPCEEMKPGTVATTVPTEITATTATTTAAIAETQSHHHSSAEEVKRRRKKRNSDGKKMTSLEDKEKDKAGTSSSAVGERGAKAEADRNAVCPWEDENVSTSDGTFVKTYATLGYL